MIKTCRHVALLLTISAPLSAEDLHNNVFPPASPAANRTLQSTPLVDSSATVVSDPSDMQIELPPVDASLLKAAEQQATSVAPQQI